MKCIVTLGKQDLQIIMHHYETSSFKTTCSRRNFTDNFEVVANPTPKIEDGEFYIQNFVCGTDPTCEFNEPVETFPIIHGKTWRRHTR